MNKPFIVAELSCNHRGSLDHALKLVDAAADSGADAVKIQVWSEDSMTADDSFIIESGPWAHNNLAALYEYCRLPWDWVMPIFNRAKERGMVGFATPFDLKALEFLEVCDCPIYKIASFEIVDLELIKAVAKTGKPMMISTGMASEDEIEAALNAAADAGNVTLLRCTSAYPASIADANLTTMGHMYHKWNADDVGVSDHTLGSIVPIVATAMGATAIEKHFCLSRADGGPDADFSMEPAEFKAMVTACREAAQAIGEVRYGPTDSEAPQVALRRSLYFAKDLPKGHTIKTEDIRTARPALGLAPQHLNAVIGAQTINAVTRGTPVTIDYIDGIL